MFCCPTVSVIGMMFFWTWILPVYCLECYPNVRVIQMSHSILAHLSFTKINNICQADYRICIAHQQDFLWPQSCPHLAQNFRMGPFHTAAPGGQDTPRRSPHYTNMTKNAPTCRRSSVMLLNKSAAIIRFLMETSEWMYICESMNAMPTKSLLSLKLQM